MGGTAVKAMGGTAVKAMGGTASNATEKELIDAAYAESTAQVQTLLAAKASVDHTAKCG